MPVFRTIGFEICYCWTIFIMLGCTYLYSLCTYEFLFLVRGIIAVKYFHLTSFQNTFLLLIQKLTLKQGHGRSEIQDYHWPTSFGPAYITWDSVSKQQIKLFWCETLETTKLFLVQILNTYWLWQTISSYILIISFEEKVKIFIYQLSVKHLK